MIISKISALLSKDKIQRISYLTALILWILIWIDDYQFFNSTSSLGIKYLWLMIIPALLLITQIIWNNIISWMLILGLILGYTIWVIYGQIFFVLISQERYYVRSFNWSIGEIIGLLVPVGILSVIIWVIVKLKPKKKIKTNNLQIQK